jgi:tRNA-dihydrouridine synthase B
LDPILLWSLSGTARQNGATTRHWLKNRQYDFQIPVASFTLSGSRLSPFPMHIGAPEPSNPVFLAPMAGVTDLPVRELAVEFGAGLAVGEMQSADLSLAHSKKTLQRQQHTARAGLRAVQIVGFDPAQMADAARHQEALGAEIIDINMGCPAKKVCRKAAGSALLADEALVSRILQAVVRAVTVPVTLKIRTGTDPENRNGPSIARIAEASGIQRLTVHGRTRADRFKGSAEYDTIAQIVDAIDIPVIANGDIDSVGKARAVLRQTGAAGIMIGRAAQGQWWLPGAIATALAEGSHEAKAPTVVEQLEMQSRLLGGLTDFHGEYLGARIARKHQAWFLDSLVRQGKLDGAIARDLRRTFNALESAQAQAGDLQSLRDYLLADGVALAA